MEPLHRLRLQAGFHMLVAAGAAGIGRAIAEAFAAAVARTLDQVAAAFGALDVASTTPAIAGPTEAVEASEAEGRHCAIDVHLTGQDPVAVRTIPLLERTGAGLLIDLVSVAGRVAYPFRTVDAASRWVVVGFTASLAKEAGRAGVRANASLPGVVHVPRIEQVIAARARRLASTTPKWSAAILRPSRSGGRSVSNPSRRWRCSSPPRAGAPFRGRRSPSAATSPTCRSVARRRAQRRQPADGPGRSPRMLCKTRPGGEDGARPAGP